MNEYPGLMSEQAFCDGFSIGVKLTAEAMENAEKLLQKRKKGWQNGK